MPSEYIVAERLKDRLMDEFFADGYCRCRCGPHLHRIHDAPMSSGQLLIQSTCGYHKQLCHRAMLDNPFPTVSRAVLAWLERNTGKLYHQRHEDDDDDF